MEQNDKAAYIKKLRYFLFAIIFITFPFTTIDFVSYLNYSAIALGVILLLLGIYLFFYVLTDFNESIYVRIVPYIGLFLSLIEFFLVISNIYPNASTDEVILQTYAAKMFLEGKDPYINGNMSGAFNFLSPQYITPELNGSVVKAILYPGLSVLIFMPVILFNIPDYTTLFIFAILTLYVTIYFAKKKKMIGIIPYLSILILIDSSIFGLAIGGASTSLWIFFLIMAYMFKDRPWLSGIFYGLSLSSKQIPIVILPFMLYMIFMNKGKSYKEALKFLLFTAFSFLVTNLPFIIMQPQDWFRNIVGAEFQPIIGIGIGFSDLSFDGLVPLSSKTFTILFVGLLIICFILYIKYYKNLKYALFVFPMLIFMLNFRVLVGYIIPWTLLCLFAYGDYINEEGHKASSFTNLPNLRINFIFNFKSIRKYIRSNVTFCLTLAIVLLLMTGGSIYVNGSHENPTVFKINSVCNLSDLQGIPGYVTKMNVNISYYQSPGLPSTSPIYFRIMDSRPLQTQLNGLLWKANSEIHLGKNTVTIYPEGYKNILPQNVSFKIQAYYNYVSIPYSSSSKVFNLGSAFANYGFNFSSPNQSNPFQCWTVKNINSIEKVANLTPNGLAVKGTGFNLSLLTTINKFSSESMYNSNVNLSNLSHSQLSLSFNYSNSGNGTIYKNSSLITFMGIKMSIDRGYYNVMIGLNNSYAKSLTTKLNSNTTLILQKSGEVNFSQILNILKGNNVDILKQLQCTFSYEISTNIAQNNWFEAYNFQLLKMN
jgi:uncharacterized membrane protein